MRNTKPSIESLESRKAVTSLTLVDEPTEFFVVASPSVSVDQLLIEVAERVEFQVGLEGVTLEVAHGIDQHYAFLPDILEPDGPGTGIGPNPLPDPAEIEFDCLKLEVHTDGLNDPSSVDTDPSNVDGEKYSLVCGVREEDGDPEVKSNSDPDPAPEPGGTQRDSRFQ